MITRGDRVLIVFIIVISAMMLSGILLYGLTPGNVYAIVESNGEFVQKISLGDMGSTFEFNVGGYIGNTSIEVRGDKVRISASMCPDKDCVRQGWISRPGQILVCLPNRVVVKIESDDSRDGLDGISF